MYSDYNENMRNKSESDHICKELVRRAL